MSKRFLYILSVLMIASMVLAACAQPATEAPAVEEPAAEEPAAEEPAAEEPAAEEPAAFECTDELGCLDYGPDEPIRIASALVISGPNAQLGQDSQWGVEIAMDWQGQLLGHDLELQAEDDGCSAEGGQTAGQKIVSDPTILGVVGTSCSGAGVPMSQVVSEASYFMVSPSNTAPSLTDPDQAWNPGYYRTAHNDKVQGAAMADFAFNELGLAEGLANAFAESFKEIGGEIVEFTAVNKGDTDMRPVLTAVSAAGPPEFLYYPIFMPECAFMTKQAKEVDGLEETVLSAADGCISADAAESIGEDGAGMFWSGPDISFGGETYEKFLADYKEKYGTDTTSVFHAHAFDATNMIIACVEQVAVQDDDGTLHIGRQAMRDCLGATSGFEGITGTLTCDEYGDCADPKISVSTLENGEYVKIWPVE
jgi:branched-chain amino acid transport system substrate-binding protein